MNIAMDFDDVLCNTLKKWIGIFNEKYSAKYDGLKFSYSRITEFSFWNRYGITHEDAWQIFQECWEQWDTMEPTEFMLHQKTKNISEMCDTLDVVTANNIKNMGYLEQFLQKHEIAYDDIICKENKEELPYDIFIDDSPINAEKIFDAGKTVFLYNQPWNRDITQTQTPNASLKRAYSLDHVMHTIQK